MRKLLGFPIVLTLLLRNGPVNAQAPIPEASLENIEAVGEPAPPVEGAPSASTPATDGALPPSDQRPASDSLLGPSIDIGSSIKKITEPNLFAGVAPNPGTLRGLAGGEAPEEYLVQEGDTLFDICDQLIDEPNYWPKLWAFNPNITNPHFVYPGMRLRFYAGDAESPPFLQVVTEDDILPVAKGQLVESELVREDLSGMLMRSEFAEKSEVINADQLGSFPEIEALVTAEGGTFSVDSQTAIIPAFIVADEFEELGQVVGGSAGSFLVDKGQQVIVQNRGGLKVGTTYSVVRKTGKIRNASDDFVGFRYEFVAQVKIDSQDSADSDFFKGSVALNRLGVQVDDIMIPYRSVKRSIPLKYDSEGKGLQQSIVGFTSVGSVVGGRGDFVFIDQSLGKLQEKQTYVLSQSTKTTASRFLREKLPENYHSIGHAYILDASGAAAVGYLVHDVNEIRIGDRIGTAGEK